MLIIKEEQVNNKIRNKKGEKLVIKEEHVDNKKGIS